MIAYKFKLDIDYKQVEIKYNIQKTTPNEQTQKTKINDILSDKNAISYIHKNTQLSCKISNVNYDGKTQYNCYWCRHPINLLDIIPLGCPIKYVPSNVYKSYTSEINKNKYIMKEDLCINNESKLILEQNECNSLISNFKDYYITDGIFCSFSCTKAYINDNSNNPLYNNSKMLLYDIFYKIYKKTQVIIPAPHWRTLIEYGGNKTIKQFRNCFNKIESKSYGNTIIDNNLLKSTSFLYEDYFKL